MEAPSVQPLPALDTAVGIDAGLDGLLTLSTGEKITNPRHERKHRARLAKAQRALAKKEKGSANRAKARLRAARIHARIAGARRDRLHKLTTELLRRPEPPTAILYDNDVMAVAGLGAAKGLGVAVPDRLSLIAWDDSTMCRLASPPLTTMSVDVHQYGVLVAETVLELIDGLPVTDRWSPTARCVPRGSTGRCGVPSSTA